MIVFEGCDRVGKSTQCRRLVDALKTSGIEAEMMSFPSKSRFCSSDNYGSISCVDRSTAIGRQINAYLSNEIELEDHSVHLLFAANRWEMVYV